ncbi:hypothetical protein N7462_010794 [Penicillium macrosclerotiorum]|uniref:uncharacterized protein n=1 Tax=Penicillium macrosclerotiorum TaxID=303699 RepID=UPI002548A260|nr:uncharacterized protein N7462_010794 [Penicillium macrosclerotiorum]KAJ5669724.1 hypothetical protein N7462_010794 [Penicillium macrosclerotiorum]
MESQSREGQLEFKVIERWENAEILNQHRDRDWLQEMYSNFESQHLLEGNEQIEYLSFVSGFVSR